MTAWGGVVVAALVALDALRLRGRASAMCGIPEDGAAAVVAVRFACVSGFHPSDAARARAVHFMETEALDVVDLWPDGVAVDTALALLSATEVALFRAQPLARGLSALQCVAIRQSVLDRMRTAHAALVERVERAGAGGLEPTDLLRLAQAAKRYACRRTDLAAWPGVAAVPEDPTRARACAEAVLGALWVPVVGVRAAWLVGLVTAALVWGEAWWAALALWAARPALALAGTRVHARRLWLTVALRPLFELRALARLVTPRAWRERPTLAERVEAQRPAYKALLEPGTARFFEPRAEACPMCGGRSLRRVLSTPDLVMGKPGRFFVDRCDACSHLFQNPRLSLDGLAFYYRDAYDGLGEEQQELTLGGVGPVYEARARFVGAHAQPRRWLDVGGGSGHLCCVARGIFPDCTFDSVDLSAGVEEAARRGWVDHAIRGLFPERAAALAGHYDVVSMSHYLEHTLTPADELAAAHTALRDGGHVFIELPDAASFASRLLGRFWFPWLQPQHLHFVSFEWLCQRLEALGFQVVAQQRGETHYPWDFALAPWLMASALLPAGDVPWRSSPPGLAARAVRALGLTMALPFMALGLAVDVLLLPFTRRAGGSNAFRVIARKGTT